MGHCVPPEAMYGATETLRDVDNGVSGCDALPMLRQLPSGYQRFVATAEPLPCGFRKRSTNKRADLRENGLKQNIVGANYVEANEHRMLHCDHRSVGCNLGHARHCGRAKGGNSEARR